MSDKAGHIKLIKYLNRQWIAVIEHGREGQITSQSVVSHDDGFPHERVEKLWELGKRIVQVAYGHDQWVVLMQEEESNDEPAEQQVKFTKEFPEEWVADAWKRKRRVVCVDYLNGQWILVTEKAKSSTTVGQTVSFSPDELPVAPIKADLWDKDKRLTGLTHHPSVGWVMVGEIVAKGTGQGCSAGSDWPTEKIADRLAKGMTIADIAWTTESEAWAIVFNNEIKGENISTKVSISEYFDEDLLRTLNLTRYGRRFRS